jgi:hypothetical protein
LRNPFKSRIEIQSLKVSTGSGFRNFLMNSRESIKKPIYDLKAEIDVKTSYTIRKG